MKQYSKIDTLLNRDEKFAVTSELRRPVFGTISSWVVTEDEQNYPERSMGHPCRGVRC